MLAIDHNSKALDMDADFDSLQIREADDQLIIGLDFGTTFR